MDGESITDKYKVSEGVSRKVLGIKLNSKLHIVNLYVSRRSSFLEVIVVDCLLFLRVIITVIPRFERGKKRR